jgi:hypothetical protein
MKEVLTGKPLSERITDRLKNSGSDKAWPATGLLETNPTRTYTNIYSSATQSSTKRQPLGSNPGAVGAGTFFTDSEDDFNKTYGLNQKKGGLRLNDFLLRPKR